MKEKSYQRCESNLKRLCNYHLIAELFLFSLLFVDYLNYFLQQCLYNTLWSEQTELSLLGSTQVFDIGHKLKTKDSSLGPLSNL